jgi:hypothetical protein
MFQNYIELFMFLLTPAALIIISDREDD